MIDVNKEKCIGCGICVKDCVARCIKIEDKKAQVRKERCIKCGHCIALCPTDAMSTTEYDMKDVVEYNEDKFKIEPETLLNFIKFRRSVRKFENKDVEQEKIEMIIDAGRFTQTATNSQDVRYIVVKEDKLKLRQMVLEGLKNVGENIMKSTNPQLVKMQPYARSWIRMYNESLENPNMKDRIFYGAPVVILVVSKTNINGALASTNMELMTNALGLGAFYSGFLVRASQANPRMKEFLNLAQGEEIVTAHVIGYPEMTYKRTVPRKDASVEWI